MTNLRIANFNNLPDAALISAKELMALSGRSRTSLWRDVQQRFVTQTQKNRPKVSALASLGRTSILKRRFN